MSSSTRVWGAAPPVLLLEVFEEAVLLLPDEEDDVIVGLEVPVDCVEVVFVLPLRVNAKAPDAAITIIITTTTMIVAVLLMACFIRLDLEYKVNRGEARV